MATIGLSDFPVEETIECPKCSSEISLHDPAGSETCICNNCRTYIRFVNNYPVQTKKKFRDLKNMPIVPLGKIGVFFGRRFKLISYLEKEEEGTGYEWREYLLYNYEIGYATLSEYNGHWTFTPNTPIGSVTPVWGVRDIKHNEQVYIQYNKYKVVLNSMRGECDWDIAQDKTTVQEFIAPPYIIFQEYEKNHTKDNQCYLGEYMFPEEVAKSFSITKTELPLKLGIGANEPNLYQKQFKLSVYISGIAAIVMLSALFLNSKFRPHQEILHQSFSIRYLVSEGDEKYAPIVSNSFLLENKYSNLEFEFSSPISNNWFESTVVLVDEKTNKTREVTKGFEYYQGYDDGGYWTEGSTSARVMMSKIPAGRYHLNIFPVTSDYNAGYMEVLLSANGILWRNFLISLIILCIYPALIWVLSHYMEVKRWE